MLKLGDIDSKVSRLRILLANSLISVFLLSLIPLIFLVLPISLVSGALRAFGALGAKRGSKRARAGKFDPDEDSGVDGGDGTTAEHTSSEVSDDELDENPFSLQKIARNVQMLKLAENVPAELANYLISRHKHLVLITFRDVATLTNHASTPENTSRIRYKKRNLKVMTLEATASLLAETLSEIAQKEPTSPTWIQCVNDSKKSSAADLCEHRKFPLEVKKLAADLLAFGSVEELCKETSTVKNDYRSEFLIPTGDGFLWFNSGF